MDYPLKGTSGRASNVHVSRRGSIDVEFLNKNKINEEETKTNDASRRRGSLDYPMKTINGKTMNMHVSRRGSVDVEFNGRRDGYSSSSNIENDETPSEFATRFGKIHQGDEEKDAINRVQSALLARRVVLKDKKSVLQHSQEDRSSTKRRGYNTVDVLTGRSTWWK